MAIVGFYKLELPLNDGVGWFMACASPEVGYLLNHTPHIGDVGHYPSKQFYFDLESSAHVHAAGYYMNHGKKYPYITEWAAATVHETDGNTTNDSIESQVMDFI